MSDVMVVEHGSALRDLRVFDGYRRPHWSGDMGDATTGSFVMSGPCGMDLTIIASSGFGWDHVSVSTPRRCPNWTEMEWVKRRFFQDDATVMQLHVPIGDHRSLHPYCLHMWRPHQAEIPRPPAWMVA